MTRDLVIVLILGIVYAGLIYHKNYMAEAARRRAVPPQTRLRIMGALLSIVSRAGVASNTKPFIVYGTLLGFVRSQNFICYDFDIDMGVDSTEYARLKAAVVQELKGFPDYSLEDKDALGYLAFKIVHTPTEVSGDVFAFHTSGGTVSRSVPSLYSTLYLNECTANYPTEWIYPLKPVWFQGTPTYAPNNPSCLLRCYYGDDFMTPDHTCDSECNRCVKTTLRH
eukprot:tig00000492_g1541.t1